MAEVPSSLLDELRQLAGRIKDSSPDSDTRRQLLSVTNDLSRCLDAPNEDLYRFIFQPGAHACYLVAFQHGIFESWPKKVMTVEELASRSGMDRIFLARIMRGLALYGIFTEVDEEVYEHSSLSTRLSTLPMSHTAFYLGNSIRTCGALPEYVKKYGAVNPCADPSQPSVFTFTNSDGLEYFDWLRKGQDLQRFNKGMTRSIDNERAGGKTFLNTYPFETELADIEGDEFTVVDVGGGWGHLLQEFRQQFPEIKGRLGLLDIPETVEGAKTEGFVPEDVVIQAYDFFTAEQPFKGARFYILRHVLHNWPDHACRTILKNTMASMTQGKSRILVIENILAPVGASAYASLFDIQMMKFGGMGRKESQWRELFESVGLRLVKAWPAVKNDRIMELVPQEWEAQSI